MENNGPEGVSGMAAAPRSPGRYVHRVREARLARCSQRKQSGRGVRHARLAVLAILGWVALDLAFGSQAGADQPEAASKPAVHHAAIIPIEDEINDITLASLQRRVEQARQAGKDTIVFQMDTPGGMANSALEICTYIKNISDLKTIAWVCPDAYSAGVMIALSCGEVVMASASKMGDCAPIVISPTEGIQELGETERAKAESPILKEFRDSAHRRGYDPLLCEAMVRKGNEIWWLEDGPGGERKFVLQRDKEKLMGEEGSRWRPVATIFDPISNKDIELRQPVVEERDLLTLTQTEALAFGFAKAIVSTESELRQYYGIEGDLTRYATNWAEGLADFLSSPLIRTILMMLIGLGVYAEFHAPGHLFGALVALIALLIFLGAPYMTGLADAWEILLVLVGVILLAVEVFVIPGFGIAGVLGILLILVGLIATFVPAEPGPVVVPSMTPGTWLGLKTGIQVVFGGLAMALAGMWLLNKYLPRIPGARGLFLPPAAADFASAGPAAYDFAAEGSSSGLAGRGSAAVDGAAGAGGVAVERSLTAPDGGASRRPFRKGDLGTRVPELRPAGKATINGRRADVIAEGQMIEQGMEVEVVDVEGARIVVREVRRAV